MFCAIFFIITVASSLLQMSMFDFFNVIQIAANAGCNSGLFDRPLPRIVVTVCVELKQIFQAVILLYSISF